MKKLIVILTVLSLVMPAMADRNYIGDDAATGIQSMSDVNAWQDGDNPLPNEASHFAYNADLLVDGDFGMGAMKFREDAGTRGDTWNFLSDSTASLLYFRQIEVQKIQGSTIGVVNFFYCDIENYCVSEPRGNSDEAGTGLMINAYAGIDDQSGKGTIHLQKRNDSNPWNGDFEDPMICNFDKNHDADQLVTINANLKVASRNNQGPSGDVDDKGKDIVADGETVKDDGSKPGSRTLVLNGDIDCYTTDMTTNSNEYKQATIKAVDFTMNGNINSGIRRINLRNGCFFELNGNFTGQLNPKRDETWEVHSMDEAGGTDWYTKMVDAGQTEQDARATIGGNGTIDDTAEVRLDGAGAINAGTRGTVGTLTIDKNLKCNLGRKRVGFVWTDLIGSYVETDIIGTECDLINVGNQFRLEHDSKEGSTNTMMITFEFTTDNATGGMKHTFIDYGSLDDQDGWLSGNNADAHVYVVIDGGTPQKMSGHSITTTEGWTINLNDGGAATVDIPGCMVPLGDITGDTPGVPDCKVDLQDFAAMAANWLVDCLADPGDAACQ